MLGWDVAIEERGSVLLGVTSDYYRNHLQPDGLQLDGPSRAIDLLRVLGQQPSERP